MFITGKIVSTLLTPPGLLVWIALLGLVLFFRWRRIGLIVLGSAIIGLWTLSLPVVSVMMLAGLEKSVQPLALGREAKNQNRAQAIVVLGGGRYANAREYGGDTVNHHALERVRYAARLHRATKLPLLVTGGALAGEERTEAELLAEALQEDFGVKARWIEKRARTTYENAKYSAEILRAERIKNFYLVTHAAHMPRAIWSFSRHGLSPTPAPMGFNTLSNMERGILGVFPTGRALYRSELALHERLGLLWYKMRHE